MSEVDVRILLKKDAMDNKTSMVLCI